MDISGAYASREEFLDFSGCWFATLNPSISDRAYPFLR